MFKNSRDNITWFSCSCRVLKIPKNQRRPKGISLSILYPPFPFPHFPPSISACLSICLFVCLCVHLPVCVGMYITCGLWACTERNSHLIKKVILILTCLESSSFYWSKITENYRTNGKSKIIKPLPSTINK